MNTHNGKIGRLPTEIREQLNQRMADGEPGATLLAWLNDLPEVRTVLAAQFGGVPVSEVNLSRWRKGGYGEWHRQRERRALVRQFSEGGWENGAQAVKEAQAYGNTINKHCATVITVDLAAAARDLLDNIEDPAQRVKQIRKILETLRHERRDDQQAQRLQLDLARATWPRGK